MMDLHVLCSDDSRTPKCIPPLTILSLSLRTVVHIADNRRELLVASARVYADCTSSLYRFRTLLTLLSTANLDDPRPINEQASTVTTIVRPLMAAFPTGFEAAARTAKGRSLVVAKDEKALLDKLLGMSSARLARHSLMRFVTEVLAAADPDVIVGLDLLGSEVDILLNRMKEAKCENWDRMSRFQRKRWPKLSAGWNSKLVAGRLFCDLTSDGSKVRFDFSIFDRSLMSFCYRVSSSRRPGH